MTRGLTMAAEGARRIALWARANGLVKRAVLLAAVIVASACANRGMREPTNDAGRSGASGSRGSEGGAGSVIGTLVALALTPLLGNQLHDISPKDPVTFLAGPGMLLVVALVASYLPARRAMAVQAVTALRAE